MRKLKIDSWGSQIQFAWPLEQGSWPALPSMEEIASLQTSLTAVSFWADYQKIENSYVKTNNRLKQSKKFSASLKKKWEHFSSSWIV